MRINEYRSSVDSLGHQAGEVTGERFLFDAGAEGKATVGNLLLALLDFVPLALCLSSLPMHSALLLLGPTGAGKTPLGETIEQLGLWGQSFAQFDFGANLRAVVEQDRPDAWITRREIDFLRAVLESGALLEDQQFPLAQRILERFLARRQLPASARLLLNGLPRHAGQAEALASMIDVRWVVVLECDPETVLARIAGNVGGDRTDRCDDGPQAVRRKLKIFAQRTAPLVDYYAQRGAELLRLPVSATMTPEAMWQLLDARG